MSDHSYACRGMRPVLVAEVMENEVIYFLPILLVR
mgnify:CR=1 FL=1